jgi:site-specific recombinase XerD
MGRRLHRQNVSHAIGRRAAGAGVSATREDDSPYLFISNRGIPLECWSWDLMQQYGQQAALPKAKQRFHALRHAIAMHLLDAGADVAFVQDRLGHANTQNTIIYMRYTTVMLDAQTRQLFASHQVS